MPSSVNPRLGIFDRFADATANFVSRAPFFAATVMLVILWLIEGAIRISIKGSFSAFADNSYQLQINTVTTVITFLLVALVQNTQSRADEASQEKLNAIAEALGDLMTAMDASAGADLEENVKELRDAVGLEDVVSADDAQ